MTDTDTESGNDSDNEREEKSYPAYFWEIDEREGVRSWRLFRETKTQKRILRANMAILSYDKFENDSATTNIAQFGFWNSVDPDQAFGERRELSPEFMDAVAGLFIKAVAARDWNIDPLFDDLEWYEDEFINGLRHLRDAANRGNPLPEEELREMYEGEPELLRERLERREEIVDEFGEGPTTIPDEINEFVKHCRSQFKLTESDAYKPEEEGGRHPNPGEEADLTSFGGQ